MIAYQGFPSEFNEDSILVPKTTYNSGWWGVGEMAHWFEACHILLQKTGVHIPEPIISGSQHLDWGANIFYWPLQTFVHTQIHIHIIKKKNKPSKKSGCRGQMLSGYELWLLFQTGFLWWCE